MGLFDDRAKKDGDIIDALYFKVDLMTEAELNSVLDQGFRLMADNGFGFLSPFPAMVDKVNAQLKIDFKPKNKKDVPAWIEKIVALDLEKKKSLFVTICFQLYRLQIVGAPDILRQVDDMLKQSREQKTPPVPVNPERRF